MPPPRGCPPTPPPPPVGPPARGSLLPLAGQGVTASPLSAPLGRFTGNRGLPRSGIGCERTGGAGAGGGGGPQEPRFPALAESSRQRRRRWSAPRRTCTQTWSAPAGGVEEAAVLATRRRQAHRDV